jgi:GNAT superfamily N-acetyltransferase
MSPHVRTLKQDDVAAVVETQRVCYRPELNESAESYLIKLAIFPDGCLGAFEGSQMAGYLFGHPWLFGTKVPLDCRMYELPANPDCMYFHDLAVVPAWRATATGRLLVERLVDVARSHGLSKFALISVQNSEGYWARWGFNAGYELEYGVGVPATYMVCEGMPAWQS